MSDATFLIKNESGYLSVRDMPSQADLREYYQKKYYQSEAGSYQKFYSDEEKLFFENKLKQRYEIVCRKLSDNANYFLDIGCGEGFALNFFKRRGWNICGLDFSSEGVSRHNPSTREFLEVGDIYELIDKHKTTKKKYDVIYLTNVLEHVVDPEQLRIEVLSLLNPGGILCVTVPNDFSPLQNYLYQTGKVKSEYWISPPDHLHYFSTDSLKEFFNIEGIEYIDLISDFPIDWFLVNERSNYIRHSKVGRTAHISRVQIENLMAENEISQVNAFYSAMANLAVGRDLTIFVQVKV